MASIRDNAEFRAMLTRREGALGSELQELTGRAFVYSTWSLRTMETDKRKLVTQKEGRETRYFLVTNAEYDRIVAKAAAMATNSNEPVVHQAVKAKKKAKENVKVRAKARPQRRAANTNVDPTAPEGEISA